MRPMIMMLLLVLFSKMSWADLIMNFNPAALSGMPGTTVTFNATLANIGASTVFLNGDDFVVGGPGLTLDDTPFFVNFPLSLSGGASVTGDIFSISIAPQTNAGVYFGSFTVVGGSDSTAQEFLATQNFQVNVTSSSSVPEPKSFVLVATAFVIIFARRSFRAVDSRRAGRTADTVPQRLLHSRKAC